MSKLKVGIIGATGMVGQRFATLLEDHPYFEVTALAASKNSAGKTYEEAVAGRWKLEEKMPEALKNIVVKDAYDVEGMAKECSMVFCAVDMPKDEVKALEDSYAKAEIPVMSNNSAHRWTSDVPMLVPEVNGDHTDVIEFQRKRLGTKRGFVAVKPNCSIQSYVPMLSPLLDFEPDKIAVTTYQAISGAGKTFKDWPEILDNVIPYIGGEEEKSEKEPLKVWGKVSGGIIVPAKEPIITAQCIRVPASNGHMAAVFMSFKKKPSKEEILERWANMTTVPQKLGLPSAPKKFITYFEEDNRPQTGLDRNIENGMGICAGRLREDTVFQYKFVGLSHNTIRGAAGGAVLSAELLYKKGFYD